jgi:hypothetical protein
MLLTILLLSTASCAAGVSDSCPPVVAYDQATQTQAADELKALPVGSVLPRFMLDYGTLRSQARACASGKVP